MSRGEAAARTDANSNTHRSWEYDTQGVSYPSNEGQAGHALGHALLRSVSDSIGAGENELCVDCGGGGVIYENWGGGRGVEDVYDVMVNFSDVVAFLTAFGAGCP